MPLISTNKPGLHKRLKHRAAETGSTIGKTVDKFTEFGLAFDIDKLTEEEIAELKEFSKNRGLSLKNLFGLLYN